MFEVVGQDIVSGEMGFIGTDPGRLYRMGPAEKTEDVTVTGNPAALNNATGKPFKDLHIYGRSEQVTTTGAQLLDTSKLREYNCTMKIEEQGRKITITGKGAFSGARIDSVNAGVFSDCIGKQVFISGKTTVLSRNANVAVTLSYILDGVTSYISCPGGENTFVTGTIPEGATIYNLQLNVNHSSETLDEDATVVFEDLIVGIGSIALPWELYTGGQPSPSPDYPQEIVSAGDDGSVNVTVKGKNLYDPTVEWKAIGWKGTVLTARDKVTVTANDGWVNASFLSPAKGETVTFSCTYKQTETTSKDTNLAFCIATSSNGLYLIESNSVTGYKTSAPSKEETTVSATFVSDTYIGIFMRVDTEGIGLTRTVELTNIQLVCGSKATSYKPYRTPQTLTLSTPNGLHGIPVSSDGNYTDENGQQWVCDEIDFGRGVYVQRVKIFDLSTLNGFDNNGIWYINLKPFIDAGNYKPISWLSYRMKCMSNRFKVQMDSYNHTDNSLYYASDGACISINREVIKPGYTQNINSNDFKEWITAHPTYVYVPIEPIETPLTTAEIEAYKALRTYRGTTIVEAEDKAGISATYKCNVKAAEKEADDTDAELMTGRKAEENKEEGYDES